MRVFAVMGTQKFPFNRLINALDDAAGNIGGDFFVQYGHSKPPMKCSGSPFLEKVVFRSMLENSDVVVTHGGVGTIRSALSEGAKVVAVPRSAVYGEHVDDHQTEIVSAFAEGGFILPCYDPSMITEAIREAFRKEFPRFNPEPCGIEEEISRLASDWGFEPFIYIDGGSNNR